jgi:hypothetical protein
MPSITIHLLVPLLVLLATRRFDPRKVWILLPLTLLPDADYFLPGLHRAALTNLWVLAIPLALYVIATTRPHLRPVDDLPAIGGAREWALIALVYLGSHLVMDMFTGGIVPLYPLSDWTACFYGYIEVETATNTPHFYFGQCSHDGIPQVIDVYTYLDLDETAMWAFVLPTLAALAMTTFIRRRRTP